MQNNSEANINQHSEKTCPRCSGTGVCIECQGSGKITCISCQGKGSVGVSSQGKPIPCRACGGKKTADCSPKCSSCNGTGVISRAYQEEISRKYVKVSGQGRILWAGKAIIITCIAVFLLQRLLPPPLNLIFNSWMAPYSLRSDPGAVWHLLTGALAHGGILHLICNLYCIFILTDELESLIGGKSFLSIFILGAASGGLLSAFFNFRSGIGASGGIYALTAVYFLLNRRFNSGSRRAADGFFFSLVFFLILGFSMQLAGVGFLDNLGHLGGLCFGLLWGGLAKDPQKKS
ncbi:rhomboid family intramembrane serine protease [bacterium]|nr:rhomboid family intramembrane serine protease [bacterium]